MTNDLRGKARRTAKWSVLGIAAVVVLRLFAAGSRVHLPNTPAPAPRFWVSATPCSVDANGDDVPDVAVRAMERGVTSLVLGLDGKTGRELWRAPAADDDRMLCAGPHAVVLAGKVSRALSARDGSSLGASPPESVEGVSDAPSDWSRRKTLFDPGMRFGAIVVTAGEGGGATPLRLTGHEGGETRWSAAVPVSTDAPSFHVAAARRGIVVVGHAVGNDHELHALYVAAADGTVAYDQTLPAPPGATAAFVDLTVDAGDRVLVGIGGMLLVIDASTGALVWSFGG